MGTVIGVLILAHLLVDFHLQTDRLAREKDKHGFVMAEHIVTCFIVTLASCVILLGTGLWDGVLVALVASLAHLTIDSLIKRGLPERWTPWRRFAVDQVMHVLVLTILAFARANALCNDDGWAFTEGNTLMLAVVASFLFVGRPVEIGVRILLESLRNETAIEGQSELAIDGKVSVADARSGRIIGILERIIVVFLTALGQYPAIAFVIAAKSIARFKRFEEDPSFAETYLVGTLASVSAAMIGTALFLVAFLGRVSLV